MNRETEHFVAPDAPGSMYVKIASSRAELQAAFALVHEAYVGSGLAKTNPYQMRVTPYHLLPSTEVFIAIRDEQVVCTMTLVHDGILGMPMEALYGEEINARRKEGVRVAEVTCLADSFGDLKNGLPALMKVMSLMAQSARRRRVDELVIAVHPRHAKFYQRFIGFTPIGGKKSYYTVCGQPAVALALNWNVLSTRRPDTYERFFGLAYTDRQLAYHPISDALRADLSVIVQAICKSDELANSHADSSEQQQRAA